MKNCRKVKAGTYEYKGFVVTSLWYYPPEKKVVWEAYDPKTGEGCYHGFSKREVLFWIDSDNSNKEDKQ